jgi:hypothetical protein
MVCVPDAGNERVAMTSLPRVTVNTAGSSVVLITNTPKANQSDHAVFDVIVGQKSQPT